MSRQEDVLQFVNRYRHRDGSYQYIGWLASPRGKLIYAAARNITDRLQAENTIRESEERFRGLFDNMSEGLAYCRMIFENGEPRDFIYIVVNAAFGTLTGLRDVVGKKITEVIPGIQESDPALFEIYGKVALTREPCKFEMHLKSMDMWFSVSTFSPLQGYFFAVFDIITERKRIERERERTLGLRCLPGNHIDAVFQGAATPPWI